MRIGWLAFVGALCAACSSAVPAASVEGPASAALSRGAPSRGAPASLDYTFELDAELHTLRVRLCPAGRLPKRLVAGARAGRALLKSIVIERAGDTRALAYEDLAQGVELVGLRVGDCVTYELDLSTSRGGFGPPELRRAGRGIMANLAHVLWRPTDYREFPIARARFVAPPEVAISVPWPSDPNAKPGERSYLLEPSAFAFHAYGAFGALSMSRIHVGGDTLDVTALEGLSSDDRAAVDRWVRVQANAAAAMAGTMPRRRVQVVVLPSGASSEPVRFGSMTRGGGASVGLLIGQGRGGAKLDEAALTRDWVLVHELSHLFHPFIAREDAWLSEGIATYYQEVLRVRAGLHSPHDAYRRLLEGSEKGRALSLSVRDAAASMYETHIFAPVYWAGATYAFMADVELRKASGGKRGLDEVIAELTRCCSRAARPWTAAETIARLDAIAGTPVFSALEARHIANAPFPELSSLYAELGIGRDGRALGPAPLSWVRDAIMRAPTPDPAAVNE